VDDIVDWPGTVHTASESNGQQRESEVRSPVSEIHYEPDSGDVCKAVTLPLVLDWKSQETHNFSLKPVGE
jgi:hypothetical protein